MALRENLAAFFNPAEFADAAQLDGVAVMGIFDEAYALGDVGQGMASSAPTFLLPTASVPADPVGKALVVGAASYVVGEHRPDGTGVSLLILEAA